MLGAFEDDRLSATGRKTTVSGNDLRLVTTLVGAENNTEAAMAAKLVTAPGELPRGGSTDLTMVFSRNQPVQQQRS